MHYHFVDDLFLIKCTSDDSRANNKTGNIIFHKYYCPSYVTYCLVTVAAFISVNYILNPCSAAMSTSHCNPPTHDPSPPSRPSCYFIHNIHNIPENVLKPLCYSYNASYTTTTHASPRSMATIKCLQIHPTDYTQLCFLFTSLTTLHYKMPTDLVIYLLVTVT